VGGTAGGYIAAYSGLLWLHWANVILAGATFCLCFFFQPETLFNREKALALSNSTSANDHKDYAPEEKAMASNIEDSASSASFRPFTFVRSLGFGVNRGGLFKQLLAPYPTLRLPGVWLAMFWYAGLIAAIVTMSTVGMFSNCT
jgi:hypothetical protein